MIRNGNRVASSGDAAANPRRQQLVREGAGALILNECDDDSDEMPVDQCFRTVIHAGLGGADRWRAELPLTPSNCKLSVTRGDAGWVDRGSFPSRIHPWAIPKRG